MICRHCATEADVRGAVKGGPFPVEEGPSLVETLIEYALKTEGTRGHVECKGCDCQHRVVKPDVSGS